MNTKHQNTPYVPNVILCLVSLFAHIHIKYKKTENTFLCCGPTMNDFFNSWGVISFEVEQKLSVFLVYKSDNVIKFVVF